MPSQGEADLLRLSLGSPALEIRRTSRDRGNLPLVVHTTYRTRRRPRQPRLYPGRLATLKPRGGRYTRVHPALTGPILRIVRFLRVDVELRPFGLGRCPSGGGQGTLGSMGDHDKDEDKDKPKPEDDGQWQKPIPPPPDGGRHKK